ncbi:hypothetical protein BDF22DRAFT_744240 [Syncephalis plumigaleata]|nr:hypothetical protein BDF22DRAFT_744240 [Syncephalis plumigaleata]
MNSALFSAVHRALICTVLFTTFTATPSFVNASPFPQWQAPTGLVNELNRLNVKATFFVDGLEDGKPWTEKEKNDLRHTYNSGHQIASHTYSHADLATLTEFQITQEMNNIENAIHEVIGVRTTTMRPPYGNDTWASIQEFKDRFNESPGSSFISLSHDIQPGTNSRFVWEVVQFLRSQGKRIVRTDECIGVPAYRN